MTESSGLLRPAFPDDTGAADPHLITCIEALDGTSTRQRDALLALATARVFVPVSAQLIGFDRDQRVTDDKHAEMALVTLTGRDGRRALPTFTAAEGLLAWRPGLRPVPVEGARAARTAIDDGAAALLLDPGQPTQLVVTGSELDQLAEVWTEATTRGRSDP